MNLKKEETITKNTENQKKIEKFKTSSLFDWQKTNTDLAFRAISKGKNE